jgi:hypothetical protein
MALNRAVVDLRVPFWEHGQLYVALSRVTDPRNLCILLPVDQELELFDIWIQVPVDRQIVGIISLLDLRSTSSGHPFEDGGNDQGLEPGEQIRSYLTTFQDQSDQSRMSHGLLTEAQGPEPEEAPSLSEEELAWNECIGAWTDGQSDGHVAIYVKLR